jgi:hypothetical protein
MEAEEFKKLLTEKAEAFLKTEDGKLSIAEAEGNTLQEFRRVFDDLSYWLGTEEGL